MIRRRDSLISRARLRIDASWFAAPWRRASVVTALASSESSLRSMPFEQTLCPVSARRASRARCENTIPTDSRSSSAPIRSPPRRSSACCRNRVYAPSVSEMRPATRYARSGPVSIAYQIVGEGEYDLVLGVPVRLASGSPIERPLGRAVHPAAWSVRADDPFDRRGVGLSDPVDSTATLSSKSRRARGYGVPRLKHAALLGISKRARRCACCSPPPPRAPARHSLWARWRDERPPTAAHGQSPGRALLEGQRAADRPVLSPGATIEISRQRLAEAQRASCKLALSARLPARYASRASTSRCSYGTPTCPACLR